MNFDVGLSVDWIREAGELRYPAEVRNKVLADLPGTGSFADILKFLVMYQLTETSVRWEIDIHR